MIRLLLDMGLPRRCAEHLSLLGLDCVHVAAVADCRSPDADLLGLARIQNRVLVTLDSDFSRLMGLGGHRQPSVLWLRMQHLDHLRATALLFPIVIQAAPVLLTGALVTVTQRGIRYRPLPLLSPPAPESP